jgi:muconolactone delta-isomerase
VTSIKDIKTKHNLIKFNRKNMNRILVILTIDTENLPDNFQEIIKHEREVVAKWKAEGILEQLFLRQTKNGAVLIFKDIDESQVNQLMPTLPLYQLKKSIEIFPIIKDKEF